MKKLLSYISNAALIAGVAIGIYVFANIYFLKSSLPEGTCPVTSNKPLMYIAIALSVISFILSFFEEKKHKPGNETV
jgi:hypothetical protein